MVERTDWPKNIERGAVMLNVLSWLLVIAAIFFQVAGIVSVLRVPRGSQLYVVPVVCWYLALQARGSGFFVDPPWKEFVIVLLLHIALVLTVGMLVRIRK